MIIRICSILLLVVVCSCNQKVESSDEEGRMAVLEEAKAEEVDQTDAVSPNTEANESETEVTDEYADVDWKEYEASMTKDYSYVIVISTKSYDAALQRAKDASEKLGYPLNLRGLHPNDEMGLSLPKEVCEGICGGDVVEYPQYLPRNDWGDTRFVSVEYSDGFQGFTKGYYIVIVASGPKGDAAVEKALSESRKFYPDAYAKTCGVWMGCGC